MQPSSQEQDLNLIPVDLPVEPATLDLSYLELDPSVKSIEGTIGDALMFLLTHATHQPDYLETAKYICDKLEINHKNLDDTRKLIIVSGVLYMKKSTKVDEKNYAKICTFLNDKLGIKLENSGPLRIIETVFLEKPAKIMNKVLTKQEISESDLDELFMMKIIPANKSAFDEERKKEIKRFAITAITDFLADSADKDTFSFFARYCEKRKLESNTSLNQVTLRIYTRLFEDLMLEDRILEAEKLLPKVQTLIHVVQEQINTQTTTISDSKHSILAEALYKTSKYYDIIGKFQSSLKLSLRAMEVYPDDAWRCFEYTLIRIGCLKKEEVRKFWLARIIQSCPLPEEVKPDLLDWLSKGYAMVSSEDLEILSQYEREKNFLQGRIGKPELNMAMDNLEMFHKAIYYAYNKKVDEVFKIFASLDDNPYIEIPFKCGLKGTCLNPLSQLGDVRIITALNQLDNEVEVKDISYMISIAHSYFNMFDSLGDQTYLEKALNYLSKANELFVDQNYFRDLLINLNLIAAGIFLNDREGDFNLQNFENASSYVCVANELFLNGTNLGDFKRLLFNTNRDMLFTAVKLGVSGEKYMEFINLHEIEIDLEEPINDLKRAWYIQLEELKSKANELQKEKDLGTLETAYSWQIGDQIYKSNDSNVFLIDPEQLMYAINDIKGPEDELKSFDIALKKGFVGLKGHGIKYIKEKYKEILEVKISSDKRSVSDTILVNPEGAKLCIFSFMMNHKEIKSTRKKLTYKPCISQESTNLLSDDALSINWQELCGFVSKPYTVKTDEVIEIMARRR